MSSVFEKAQSRDSDSLKMSVRKTGTRGTHLRLFMTLCRCWALGIQAALHDEVEGVGNVFGHHV